MMIKRTALLIALAFFSGCTATGRYQIGNAFAHPNTEGRTVIPMIDTRTGQLYMYSGSSYGNNGTNWVLGRMDSLSGMPEDKE